MSTTFGEHPIMTTNGARFWLGIALPAVAAIVGFGSWLRWRGDLPGEVATHFGTNGVPDGSSSVTTLVVSFGIPLVLGALINLFIASRPGRYPRPLVVTLGFVGGLFVCLFAALLAAIVWTQRDLATWTDARLSPIVILSAIACGFAGGALGAWLASSLGEPEQVVEVGDPTAPVLELAPGENAVWVDTQTLRPLLLVPVVVVVASLIARLFFVDRWLAIAAPCLIALIVLAFASYRLRVDATGLQVRSVIVPWPRLHLDVDEIRAASMIDVRPMQWGGWGYRGSLKLMKQAALVQRAGPGMRLDLDGGRVFVVTTDRPETPVALLNAFVKRRSTSVS